MSKKKIPLTATIIMNFPNIKEILLRELIQRKISKLKKRISKIIYKVQINFEKIKKVMLHINKKIRLTKIIHPKNYYHQ